MSQKNFPAFLCLLMWVLQDEPVRKLWLIVNLTSYDLEDSDRKTKEQKTPDNGTIIRHHRVKSRSKEKRQVLSFNLIPEKDMPPAVYENKAMTYFHEAATKRGSELKMKAAVKICKLLLDCFQDDIKDLERLKRDLKMAGERNGRREKLVES